MVQVHFHYQEQLVRFTDVTISTVSNSQGGSESETNEFIRHNAPLNYLLKKDQLHQVIMRL